MKSGNSIKSYTVGIDLGGTNTAIGIVDNNGVIAAKVSIPTKTLSPDLWADMVISEVFRLSEEEGINKLPVLGIGLGAPCANNITGTIEGATDLPWDSPINLIDLFKKRSSLPVAVTNDANAAAIGEMIYGSAKGLRNFIVLTLGTGVGAGIVVDGHLLNGRRGFAGELGHVSFHFASDRKCGCGRYGCLQTVASASGIVVTALRFLETHKEDSVLRSIESGKMSAKIIAQAAEEGDHLAREVFSFTGECLGKAAAQYAAFTDPEAIILFGGVSKAGSLILDPMKKAFKENSMFLYKDSVEIITSEIPESDSAIIGAASLPYL